MITAIEIPTPAPRSLYLKIRERESYEYATVSVALALELTGSRIRRVRIALGSVAHCPWRLGEAERALAGLTPGSPEATAAVAAGFADARSLAHNA